MAAYECTTQYSEASSATRQGTAASVASLGSRDLGRDGRRVWVVVWRDSGALQSCAQFTHKSVHQCASGSVRMEVWINNRVGLRSRKFKACVTVWRERVWPLGQGGAGVVVTTTGGMSTRVERIPTWCV